MRGSGLPLGVLAVASWSLVACSGGETVIGVIDRETSEDSSVPDDVAADEADAAEDLSDEADVEDGPGAYDFDFYVFGVEYAAADFIGAPIDGAHVAVDLPAGREDLLTGSDGGVHVSLPFDAPDVTLTAAKVGWLPVTTIYRATRAELQERIAEDGRLFALVFPVPAPPTGSALLSVTSPSPARFVASIDFWDTEAVVVGLWQRTIRSDRASPRDLVAYSTDADQCPVELYATTIPDLLDDRTVEAPFDGTGTAVPEQAEITIRLPADPDRPTERADVMTSVRRPFYVLHDAAHRFAIRGGACVEEVSPDGTTMEASVRWFPPATGELKSLLYVGLLHVDLTEAGWWDTPMTYELLYGPPTSGATYDVLDIPRVYTMPYVLLPTPASTFLPPDVAGGTTADLIVSDDLNHARQLWVARSFRLQQITLPELPAGYDRAVDWPDHDQAGYRLRTCTEPVPVNEILYPGAKCSLSAVRSGRFE